MRAHPGWRNVLAVPAPVDATPRAIPSSEPTRSPFRNWRRTGWRSYGGCAGSHRRLFELLLVEDHPCEGTKV